MAIQKELKHQSIVILGQNFNPTIFNRYWLVHNKFFRNDEIHPSSTFTPVLSNVVTNNIQLIVVPQQLQFNLLDNTIDFKEQIINVLIPIIKRLKEIPYTAIGINFTWNAIDDDKDITLLSRELFGIKESQLHKNFKAKDSKFGTYLSKDFKGSRLKLDIKPTKELSQIPIEGERLTFAFNFHIDLTNQNPYAKIVQYLKHWEKYHNESYKIINSI